MEKTRVPKDEKYYYIDSEDVITLTLDGYTVIDNIHYNLGNYFSSIEEAESIAKKLRAVLRGADVIEEWEGKEVLNTLRVALSTEYGFTGLDSQREINEKITKTPETCLMRMLKKSIEIMSKIVK